MITRTKDAEKIRDSVGDYDLGTVDFDEWVARDTTIALVETDDVSLFQEDRPGVFFGHWFFKTRGKAAKAVALEMLDHLFGSFSNVQVILGFTPVENLGARWLARQVGFKSQGPVTWKGKDLEFFMLTRQEWNDK